MKHTNNWDQFFHNICEALASKSPCLSRQLGAVLARNNYIISTGYNGPPKGVPHCGYERLMKDNRLSQELNEHMGSMKLTIHPTEIKSTCPRQLLDFSSGEGLEYCTAAHAERNAIITAAKLGVSVENTTLYLNCDLIPCAECLKELINVGVKEIVIEKVEPYNSVQFLLDNSNIKVREFILDE